MNDTIKVKVTDVHGNKVIGYSTVLATNGNRSSIVIKEYKAAVEKEVGFQVLIKKV